MANSNSSVPRNRAFHGARGYIVIRGKPVGYAQQATVGEDFNMVPIDTLDSLEVAEFVAAGYTVTFTASFVLVVGRSLKDAGVFQSAETALTAEEFVIEIKDRPTDRPVKVIEGVKAKSVNATIQKGAITAEQVVFVAKRVRDQGVL